MICSDSLQRAREDRGHLRTFMLAMLKRIITLRRRSESAAKRGGSTEATVSFDELEAEEWYQNEPADIRGRILIATRRFKDRCVAE